MSTVYVQPIVIEPTLFDLSPQEASAVSTPPPHIDLEISPVLSKYMLDIAASGRIHNLRLVGPTGCGKTSIGQWLAGETGRPYLIMDCSVIREPRDWFGYRTVKAGEIAWQDTQFVRTVESGNAIIILDELNPIAGLADSKKLSARRREALFDEIRAKALCCSIALATVEEIDELNILHATMLAMRRAVEGLRLKPALVQVDGNRVPPLAVPAQAIVQGDAKVQAISAASILAKVHRDRLCDELHQAYPHHGFDGHKGYPTAEHIAALRLHGVTPHHRRSFGPVKVALGLAPDPSLVLRRS